MIDSFGLAHIQIRVGDLDRSVRFYGEVFGVRPRARDESAAFMVTPGANDVLTLALVEPEFQGKLGDLGAVAHFGFRLKTRESVSEALGKVAGAGGKVLSRGERGPEKHPWAFVADPDGYKVEVFCE